MLAHRTFRRVFIALAGILDHPLRLQGDNRLERVSDASIREQLHPVLTAGDRPSAGDLRATAWQVVGPLLILDAAEREYVDRLHAGELRPDLLFPDDEEAAAQIRAHPALIWKAQNARDHAKGPDQS